MPIYKPTKGHGWNVILETKSTDGKRRRKSYGCFATRIEAKAKLREIENAIDRGERITPSEYTLAKVADLYFADPEKLELSGTTIYGYQQAWTRAKDALGDIRVDKIRAIDLSNLYTALRHSGGKNGRSLSPKTVSHVRSFVRAILQYAVERELVARNVATSLKRERRQKHEAEAFSPADVEKLVYASQTTRHAPLVAFVIATGMRRGELSALRWDDISFGDRTVTVRASRAEVPGKPTWIKRTKTDAVRVIPMNDIALAALKAQKLVFAREKIALGENYNDAGFIFCPPHGGFYTPNSVYKAFARIARAAGLTLTKMHAARHTNATWLIRAGVDVRTVAALLGHSTPATTLAVYAHVFPGAKAEAVMHIDRILDASEKASAERMAEKRQKAG